MISAETYNHDYELAKDFGYEQGRADAIEDIYNEIVYIENKFRSMLLNTRQENNLIEWVDLNGKLMAITTIKHLITDKLKEQKRA